MQVYPDIIACKYIRVRFLSFKRIQSTKYPLILACNTKRGKWVNQLVTFQAEKLFFVGILFIYLESRKKYYLTEMSKDLPKHWSDQSE